MLRSTMIIALFSVACGSRSAPPPEVSGETPAEEPPPSEAARAPANEEPTGAAAVGATPERLVEVDTQDTEDSEERRSPPPADAVLDDATLRNYGCVGGTDALARACAVRGCAYGASGPPRPCANRGALCRPEDMRGWSPGPCMCQCGLGLGLGAGSDGRCTTDLTTGRQVCSQREPELPR